MRARFCYRCGHEFKDGENYQLLYVEQTDRLVPVCRDDRFCEEQRPGRAAQEAVKYAKRQGGQNE